MITLVCTIAISIATDIGNWSANADVEGKMISQSETKYLVDFSKGLGKYTLAGKPSDYSEVLVEKYNCVKK